MSTIIITGVNGFVGEHLARACKEEGHKVVGVGHEPTVGEKVKDIVDEYAGCDLTDEAQVKERVSFKDINTVIHLAGLPSVTMSFEQPKRFIADNSAMLINLFEAARDQQLEKNPRFVVISSGAVYSPGQSMPITEEGQVTHNSPYAISKLLNENLCDYYRSRGFEAIVARPFNHTGPGQLPGFLLPDLAKQVKKAQEAGDAMMAGNLKSRRDYTDVRDIAKAYLALATQEKLNHNLYNVCSGRSVSGEEILDAIVTTLGIEEPAIEVDQSRIRPNDPPDIYGSHERLKIDTGWEPQISFKGQTIPDFLKTGG